MSQSGHERLVDANPNPLGTCFCGVVPDDCPRGPGYVSPNEIEGVPGNYANFVSLECVRRMAAADGEAQHVSQEPRYAHATRPDNVGGPWTGDAVGPEPHVNPEADSLEEATRLLEEQDRLRLEDDGGPVI